jgi:hypothetical protein
MTMNFKLTEEQVIKIEDWKKTLPVAATGAIGGRIEYSFVMTHIGVVAKVRDLVSQKELDITDYTTW